MSNKVVLIVLDGFGASAVEEGNAVLKAKTPFLDYCWGNFSKTLLRASGEEVGLTWGEMGNSEVGHLNLGTGRVSMQDLPRINASIKDGSFFKSENLLSACSYAKKNKSTLHLIGLLSTGGVHAHIDHLLALIDLAKQEKVEKVAIHIITDGRDMPKQSAAKLLKILSDKIAQTKTGAIATMIGRFYAMDRDNNWDRIEKAYNLLVLGEGKEYGSYDEALKANYNEKKDDENIEASILDKKYLIENNNAVIFYNFRSDRAKELSETIINPEFKHFSRKKWPKNVRFVSFVSYGNEQTPLVDVAYVAEETKGQLAEVLATNNASQFHIAETEKYAHVTYFFNGGIETPYSGEERILIPSPRVPTYNQKPEMSATEITASFVPNIKEKKHSFTVVNYANADMVGHTGDYKAAIKACETVDSQLGKILTSIDASDTALIITADHGNVEQMINPRTGEIDTEHTANPVPCIIVKPKEYEITALNQDMKLANISPTILKLLNVNKPNEMEQALF